MEQFSERALAKQAEIDAKQARGEKVTWSDMLGILEPNPNLPDCQSWEGRDGPQCQLPNHHEGQHRATLEW
jgi:hypothetical protein